MESVIDTVSDVLADTSDLVLDTAFGSDGNGGGGRGRKGLLLLLLIGAVVALALWRRSQASKVEDGTASDRP
jgi:hypothetical protein